MKWCVCFVAALVAALIFGSVATAQVGRELWAYEGGHFRLESGNPGPGAKWIEPKQGQGAWHFKEVSRCGAYVELYDSSRGYYIRLFDNEMQIQGGRGNVPYYPTFTKMYAGRWLR